MLEASSALGGTVTVSRVSFVNKSIEEELNPFLKSGALIHFSATQAGSRDILQKTEHSLEATRV